MALTDICINRLTKAEERNKQTFERQEQCKKKIEDDLAKLKIKIDEKEKNSEKIIISLQKKKEEELIKETKERQHRKDLMQKNIQKQLEKRNETNKKFFEKQEKIEQNVFIMSVEKKKINKSMAEDLKKYRILTLENKRKLSEEKKKKLEEDKDKKEKKEERVKEE